MDANKLQVTIMKNGFTLGDISDLLGTTRIVTHRKLTDVKQLTIMETLIIKEFLELTNEEAIEIFFGE